MGRWHPCPVSASWLMPAAMIARTRRPVRSAAPSHVSPMRPVTCLNAPPSPMSFQATATGYRCWLPRESGRQPFDFKNVLQFSVRSMKQLLDNLDQISRDRVVNTTEMPMTVHPKLYNIFKYLYA